MPISLRLPADTETSIADFGARHGLSKTAVIMRSIREFLVAHAQASSLQLYEDAMRENAVADSRSLARNAAHDSAEKRPRKLAIRDAIHRKHANRSARASQDMPGNASTARRRVRKQA